MTPDTSFSDEDLKRLKVLLHSGYAFKTGIVKVRKDILALLHRLEMAEKVLEWHIVSCHSDDGCEGCYQAWRKAKGKDA